MLRRTRMPVVTALSFLLLIAARPATQGEPSPLYQEMSGLKANLKSLAMSISGSDTDAALRHVAAMQQHALTAKLMEPANLDAYSGDEAAAHQVAFRKRMASLLSELIDLEVDLLDGDPQAAFARVTGSLYKLREAAHTEFQNE